MEREDAEEHQRASQPSERAARTSQGRGSWTQFALTRHITELAKGRTHLKQQLLLFFISFLSFLRVLSSLHLKM